MREQEKFIANQIINAIKNATINRTMSKEKKEIQYFNEYLQKFTLPSIK